MPVDARLADAQAASVDDEPDPQRLAELRGVRRVEVDVEAAALLPAPQHGVGGVPVVSLNEWADGAG